jgi:hypothetical protein
MDAGLLLVTGEPPDYSLYLEHLVFRHVRQVLSEVRESGPGFEFYTRSCSDPVFTWVPSSARLRDDLHCYLSLFCRMYGTELRTAAADCPECWGTGFRAGWGAPCSRGCKVPAQVR